MSEQKYTNALINETSPYLLQHAHNPVEWYPWGDEALARAKREDKPILLSIGYSACHWCHVMAHESFEDEETARLMNENFINVKVDREERPDLDSIYMSAVQLTTGSGGWPMTVFLTPDQNPFFCGTYFPPKERYGMPSFRQVLLGVIRAYSERRDIINQDAETIATELRRSGSLAASQGVLEPSILTSAGEALRANYEPQYGGFGQAPKFPPSMALTFLMRLYSRGQDPRYFEMVDQTLMNMACGGMYDQIGGGFHRYSVDARWLVPHFEKMLYDNALLSRAYQDGYLLTRNEFYKRICLETLDYVAREMTSPEGGFYSSQDADTEGKEGAFFVWTVDQIREVMGDEDGDLFCRYYHVTPEGNFEGKNILYVQESVAEIARNANVSEARLLEVIQKGRDLLFEAREARVKPGRDEKILTAWNGLMLRSFAEAANTFDREDYREIAVRNAEFLLSQLQREGQLFRSYKDGQSRFNAYLDDYACLADGLISLYEACFDPRWIHEAERLSESMIGRFWDAQDKGFFFTPQDHESLICRPKEFVDNAIPSGNSVAAYALLRLSELTGDDKWREYAVSILERMAGFLKQHPPAFPNLLCALDFCLGPPKEIAVVGNPDEAETKRLLGEVFDIYLPNKVIACGFDNGVALLRDRTQTDGVPTAYICENYRCGLPITDPDELAKALS